MLAPHVSLADEPVPAPPADTTTPVPAPTPPVAPPPPVMPPPAAPVPPAPPSKAVAVPDKPMTSEPAPDANAPTTDHQLVVGTFGLGYVGSHRVPLPSAVPVGRGDQAGMIPNDKLVLQQMLVPMVGMRRWFSKRTAFDAAVGVSVSGGSRGAEYGDTTAALNKSTLFALSVQAGVPITIADTRHMAFMLIPQVTLGFATSDVAAEFLENAPPSAKLRGGAFDAGVRAGAELHFGFIGLPRLSLQAGVGLFLHTEWSSASVSNQSLKDTTVSLGFGSTGNPWDIFSGAANVSARYYF